MGSTPQGRPQGVRRGQEGLPGLVQEGRGLLQHEAVGLPQGPPLGRKDEGAHHGRRSVGHPVGAHGLGKHQVVRPFEPDLHVSPAAFGRDYARRPARF